MTKGEKVLGGDTVHYTYPDEITKKAKEITEELNAIKWSELGLQDKAEIMAKLIAELWQVHPFREGNTRTVITFMVHFAEVNGFPMDNTLFRENPEYTRNALVKASDGEYSDYEYLVEIIKDSIEGNK